MHQAFNAAAHSFFINCLNFIIADLVAVLPACLPWCVTASLPGYSHLPSQLVLLKLFMQQWESSFVMSSKKNTKINPVFHNLGHKYHHAVIWLALLS